MDQHSKRSSTCPDSHARYVLQPLISYFFAADMGGECLGLSGLRLAVRLLRLLGQLGGLVGAGETIDR